MGNEQKMLVLGRTEKIRAPVERKNRIFVRACAPILAAAMAVGGSSVAGCTTEKDDAAAKFDADLAEAFAALNAAIAKPGAEHSATETATSEKATEALVKGAAAGNLGTVKKALDTGADVNAKFDEGMAVLMVAVAYERIKVVELLIAKGADVNAKDDDGITALMVAAEGGNNKIAEKLIERGADVNAKDENAWSALMYAMINKQSNTAKMLIRNGADVNLIIPITGPVEVDNGSIRYAWESLLKLAIDQGDILMVKTLVENGAKIEACDQMGKTPFLATAEKGNLKILQYLRARGANTKAVMDGKNAIMLAINSRNVKAAEFLLKMAAPGEFDGINELREAARLGNVGLAKKLVAKGADFRETDWIVLTKDGVETPLMSSASAGKAKMVEYLLKTPWINARDAKDEYGQTALMRAAVNGNKRCVRLLLDAHASMNARDTEGKTALSYAEENGKKEVYEMLLSEGAKY